MATLAAESARPMALTDPDPDPAVVDPRALYAGLVADHAEGVARYIYGMTGDRALAEDLAQDVFLRAWQHRSTLRDPAAARSWLFAIAANTARRHLRRAGRFGWLPLEAWHTEAPRRLPAGLDDSAVELEQALAQVSAEDREVLLLVGQQELSIAEAAAVLGIAPEATKKRWQRACARFKKVLAAP
jgi:RNA polymerase sigma-70 factor (ECF subfamily)